jgi:hypothetical protein
LKILEVEQHEKIIKSTLQKIDQKKDKSIVGVINLLLKILLGRLDHRRRAGRDL